MGFFMMNWWTFRNTILLWYHFVCCTFSSEIYVYLKPWILSSRNICPVPLLCAGIFLKDSLLHVWLNATLQYYFVTRFMFILFGVGPASHMSSALLGSTWCQLYSSSVLSWNLIFHARLCCISTWCHDINLLWAVQELDILWATVLYISTWCHWRPSTVSIRGTWDFMCVSVICQRHDFITHSGCREKYSCYIDAVYISTLCSTSLCFIMLSDGAYFHRGFSHGMCIFWRTWCWVSLMTAWCRTVIFECEHV